MRQLTLDRKITEEAQTELRELLKMMKNALPKGWKLYTWMAPIQYEKTVRIGGKTYLGYLRSRHNFPFSIEIYEKGRKFKLQKLIFSHKPADSAENLPPLRSIKIIERQFEKMRREIKICKKCGLVSHKKEWKYCPIDGEKMNRTGGIR